MAKLTQGGDIEFPKFKNPGDNVRGTFLSYQEEAKGGKFGPENVLLLRGEDGKKTIHVRCPATLSKALRENPNALQVGAFFDIKMTGTKPSKNFPQPMKLFDIDVTPPGDAPPPVAADAAPAAEDESIPF